MVMGKKGEGRRNSGLWHMDNPSGERAVSSAQKYVATGRFARKGLRSYHGRAARAAAFAFAAGSRCSS